MTKASAAPRRCSSTTGGSIGWTIKVLRIFNTYGPGMRPDDGRVVSNFIVQALRGEDITIYGDGRQTRSFCYVDDLIESFVLMMQTADQVTGPVNIGNPKEFTMLGAGRIGARLTGSKSKMAFARLPSDDPKPAPTRHFRSQGQARDGTQDIAARRPEGNHRLFQETLEPLDSNPRDSQTLLPLPS